MADAPPVIEIPDRALFKAAEVCDLLRMQPYVLKSWEAEFPGLGVTKTGGGSRVYRKQDVEQALRIRHLLLVDGLTLAGARRKLEEDAAPIAPDVAGLDQLLGENARERVADVRQGLRALLDLLSGRLAAGAIRTVPAPAAASRSRRAATPTPREVGKKVARRKAARSAPSPERKRSA
jgi:DNA-binding transcriptional MerR regulator